MTFKELKEVYENACVNEELFSEIVEHEEVESCESNGNSGLFEDCMWYTAYSVGGDDFNFYTRLERD